MSLPSQHSDIAIEAALTLLRAHPRPSWLDLARQDQSERWRFGQRVRAEDYFHHLPELLTNREETLVLICGEVLLRRELGEDPQVKEYQCRFPDLSEDLAVQFEMDECLDHKTKTVGVGDAADRPSDELELPGYEFLGELGRGASGVVLMARQRSLNRIVAIKVLSSHSTDERQKVRQQREADALARLRHPNVVHIYEILRFREQTFIVMEYVDGPALSKKFRGTVMRWRDATMLVRTLAEAIDSVHCAGVLHRDLKPSNILLTESGELKVVDFGLAKLRDDSSSSITGDTVLGTPCYMAPEQAVGESHSITKQCDIYSLGAILYELLTGRPPHLGSTLLDTLSLVKNEVPVSLRQLQPKSPRELETVCMKCLEKKPSDRYQNASDLASELQCILDGIPIRARPISPLRRAFKWASRHPSVVSMAFLLIVFIVSMVAGISWHYDQRRRVQVSSLVDSLISADPANVPRIIDRLADYPGLSPEVLHSAMSSAEPNSRAWLHLRLALIDHEPSQAAALANYVAKSRPDEISLLATTLARFDNLKPLLSSALVKSETSGEQLRVACVLAGMNAQDPQWGRLAIELTDELVRSGPLHSEGWIRSLRPIREPLRNSLTAVFADENRPEPERLLAASALAYHYEDQPEILTALLLDAEPSQFRVLFSKLALHVPLETKRLYASIADNAGSLIATVPSGLASNAEEYVTARRQMIRRRRQHAIAAIALARLGQASALQEILHHRLDPTSRSFAIELAAPCELSSEWFIREFVNATDVSLLRACILALGQYEKQSLHQQVYQQMKHRCFDIYCTHPDSGLREASGWLLKQWGLRDDLHAIDAELSGQISKDRTWYVNRERQTYAVLPPGKFQMGSPDWEDDHEDDEIQRICHVNRSLAVATHEVTVRDYLRFKPEAYISAKYSPSPDGPMVNVSWYEAAAYCRWLSEREGISEEQMCFPPLHEIRPGMVLPADYIGRTSYRLPTDEEWEYACRANSITAWSFGNSERLMSCYLRATNNSGNRAWPVGSLKPSDFGLFDMHGNAIEWCVSPIEESTEKVDVSDNPTEIVAVLRRTRGGSFGDNPFLTRSARRSSQPADSQWATTGFRPVRTMPAETVVSLPTSGGPRP